MKTTQVIGLFVNSDRTDKVLNSLVIAGINSESLFSSAIGENVYAVSVFVKDPYEYKMVKNIFSFYKVIKYFVTDYVEAKNIKDFIVSRSRAEIYTSPEIRKRTSGKGISSEVQFG